MARFSDDELDDIRRNPNIVDLIEGCGTTLKQRPDPNEYVGLCPFHDDKEASLHVNKAKGVWHCKGGCGGGDTIAWVMKFEKVSFTHAIELLKAKAVGRIAGNGTKAAFARRLENPIQSTAEDQQQLFQVASYYHDRLKDNPDAIEYLKSRGLYDQEAIIKFDIGVCDRTLGLRIPSNQIKAGKEQRAKLEALGVIKQTGHEALRGCVTFPVITGEGKVGEIYGRRITRCAPNERHWYLSGPHVGVWNGEAFQASDTIILCEGIIDALTFYIAGFRNVTCTYGKSGFTDEIFQKFIKSDTKRCYVGFDNDSKKDPTDNAAMMAAERLMGQGIECFRIEYPHNANDANAYAMMLKDGNGTAHGPLQMLINNAVWMGMSSIKSGPTLPASATQPNDSQDSEPFIEPPPRTKPYNIPPACELFEQAEKRVAEQQQTQAPKEESPRTSGNDLPDTKPTQVTVDGPTKHLLLGAKTQEPAAAMEPNQATVPVKVPTASSGIEVEIKDNEIIIPIGNRSYRIRGLAKNTNGFDSMKVNVLARKGEAFFVDTLDIYAARGRNAFIKEASRELALEEEIIKRDLGKVLLKLEELQDSFALANIDTKKIEITEADKKKALELLQSPDLLDRILNDFDACGVVGERTNKLVGYLAATSRKLDRPLAIMVQSSSAAGKSSLMEAILRFMPGEEQISYSAMTGQSLFYMGGMDLKHKVLAIAEEEGIRQASYALKLLQSEGQLTIASTGKDPGTGRMETQEYHVEGPVMIFLTTTAIDVDEELLNRCLVLTVDEDRKQTRAIHSQQRLSKTKEGLRATQNRATVIAVHQNAHRLLRPLHVVNEYAEQLDFSDDQTRRRRDHIKYLTLIESVALLHQYQRPVHSMEVGGKTIEYIEVIPRDIAVANTLAEAVLGKSIDDLPPQTRRLLRALYDWVRGQCDEQAVEQHEFRFTRRVLREALAWSQTAIKRHLERIIDMEYIIVHRAGSRICEYELLYDGRGREGQPTLCGLLDPAKLKPIEPTTTIDSTHPNGGSSQSTIDSTQDERPITQDEPSSTQDEPSSSPQDHTENTASTAELIATVPTKTQGESDTSNEM